MKDTQLEKLDKIIGLCRNRCDEIINKNVSIDYHIYMAICDSAESLRMDLYDEVEQNATNNSRTDNEASTNADIDDKSNTHQNSYEESVNLRNWQNIYKEWKNIDKYGFEDLKERLKASTIDDIDDNMLTNSQILFKYSVNEEVNGKKATYNGFSDFNDEQCHRLAFEQWKLENKEDYFEAYWDLKSHLYNTNARKYTQEQLMFLPLISNDIDNETISSKQQ